jgi:hypothetical protein
MQNKVVTCPQCVARRAHIAASGKHDVRASELYRVGAEAGVDRTHQMYFSIDGKIALCAAGKQTPRVLP